MANPRPPEQRIPQQAEQRPAGGEENQSPPSSGSSLSSLGSGRF